MKSREEKVLRRDSSLAKLNALQRLKKTRMMMW